MRWRSLKTYNALGGCILIAAVVAGLYLCSLYSYLLFHALVEIYIIAVALGIFFITWNTRNIIDDRYLLFLGIAFLFVASVEVLHMLAYKGMGVFQTYDADLPTQLWILAGYMESAAFLLAPFFVRQQVRPNQLFLIFTLITVGFLTLIFLRRFPNCFIEGSGLTPFKKSSEIIISLMLSTAGGLLYHKRDHFDPLVLNSILIGIGFHISARIAFIFYRYVDGLSNQIGHYLLLASFYCIYKAIIATGLIKPHTLLFRELEQQKIALQEAQERLEQRVEERTRELVCANDQLKAEMEERNKVEELLAQRHSEVKQINQELEAFAYIVSHDLREPLRGIHNFSNLLLENYSGQFDADGCYMLEHLSLLSKRMEDQIAAILQYSRIGREGMVFKRTDLNEVLRVVLYSLNYLITEHHADIRIPNPLPVVLCDPMRIQEVFRNLIANAVKYSDKPNKWVEIGYIEKMQYPQCVVLYVQDNGIGIKREHFEKIFQIFQRVHSKKLYGEGTGVGLTISKKIIERHGGKLWVESEPGIGTTFYLTLLKGNYEASHPDCGRQ